MSRRWLALLCADISGAITNPSQAGSQTEFAAYRLLGSKPIGRREVASWFGPTSIIKTIDCGRIFWLYLLGFAGILEVAVPANARVPVS
jgi:hypothetical protein